MALAVSHGPFTVKAKIQPLASQCGICGGKNGTGTGFLLVLLFSPFSNISQYSVLIPSFTPLSPVQYNFNS